MTTTTGQVNFTAPAGTLILNATATRQDWLNARTLGLGGSDIATITGANKYATPYDIWLSKVDPTTEDESTEAMWWGTHTEALTVARFEDLTGLTTRRTGMYASKAHPHHMVSPDRFTSDGGVLEVKDHESLSDAGKTVTRGEITDHALVQLQWAMHVTGRSHGWFVAKVGKKAHVLGPIPRDDEHIARLVAFADAFWVHVQSQTPPPVNWASVTSDEVAARFPTVDPDTQVELTAQPIPDPFLADLDRLREIKAGAAQLAGEQEAIETRLKALIGEREWLTVEGRPVARWQQVAGRRSFDKPAALKAIASLTGKTPVEVESDLTKQGTPTRRFSLVDVKEA